MLSRVVQFPDIARRSTHLPPELARQNACVCDFGCCAIFCREASLAIWEQRHPNRVVVGKKLSKVAAEARPNLAPLELLWAHPAWLLDRWVRNPSTTH
jgi:hypothetical protein